MQKTVLHILDESIRVKNEFIRSNTDAIVSCAEHLAECLSAGHKILIFGNGGSAADAQHIAAEFVNRFEIERRPLAAIALATDTSAITSIGNDYDFDEIFAKQVLALGKAGDVAWGISTSGNSPNVVSALFAARRKGLSTLGLTGHTGGKMTPLCDLLLAVDSRSTARIQETHITVAHILCALVDRILFPQSFPDE